MDMLLYFHFTLYILSDFDDKKLIDVVPPNTSKEARLDIARTYVQNPIFCEDVSGASHLMDTKQTKRA
jgi:hypothetical protein